MSCVPEIHGPQNRIRPAVEDIQQSPVYVNRLCRSIFLSAAFSLALSACSVSSTEGISGAKEEFVTNSVAKPVIAEGIGSEDAEIIKRVVAQSDADNLLAWQNPESGNKGTITAIDNFVGSHGQHCKKFQTTVDSFMGISLYNGETCELKKDFWVLSWFLRQDS